MLEQRDWIIEQADKYWVANDEALRIVVGRLPQKELLTVSDVAAALNVDSNVVVAWCDMGRVNYFNASSGEHNQYRKILRTSLINFIKSRMG